MDGSIIGSERPSCSPAKMRAEDPKPNPLTQMPRNVGGRASSVSLQTATQVGRTRWPAMEGNMNEGPDLVWLAVLVIGVAALAAVMIYGLTRYRNWQDGRRHSRPTD
jgi:hypothetical protein